MTTQDSPTQHTPAPPPRPAGWLKRALDSDMFYSWRRSPVTVVATVVALALILMALFAMSLGLALGLTAGYNGGVIDAVIMRIADIQLSFPAILIALLIFGIARGVIPASQQENMAIWVLILAIGLSNWAQFARTVR